MKKTASPWDQVEGAAEGVTLAVYALRINNGWRHEDAVAVGIGPDAARPDYVPPPEPAPARDNYLSAQDWDWKGFYTR